MKNIPESGLVITMTGTPSSGRSITFDIRKSVFSESSARLH